MKCSLKDGFISILLITLIPHSKGIEFPLLLQTNSVLDKPMNFPQFKAAINRLQDLDSFPDVGNSEGKLHKIVKKQMVVADTNESKKSKRSILFVFNPPTNYNRAARNSDDFIRKETKKKKYGAKNNDRFCGGSQHEDSKKPDEILTSLKDIVKDKQYFFVNRMEKKILLHKLEEKKAKAKNLKHSSHVRPDVKEYKPVLRPKSALKEKLKSTNFPVKPHSLNAQRVKEAQNFAKTTTKVKEDSGNKAVKKKLSLLKSAVKDRPNSINYLKKETKFTSKSAVKEGQNTQNSAIQKETKNIRNVAIEEVQNTDNTAEQRQSSPNSPISERQFSPNVEEKEIADPTKTSEIQKSQMNTFLRKKFKRIPDEHDCRYYYECQKKPFGCIKLRHKRCPEGQFFSYKYLKCSKAPFSKSTRATTLTDCQRPALQVLKEPAIKALKESTISCLKVPALKKSGKAKRAQSNSTPKKIDIFDSSDDPEPANEWMDANQGPIQKIPPEFKPKKTPKLKIYHLCSKRKTNALLRKTNKRHVLENSFSKRKEYKRDMADAIKCAVKRHNTRQHHPRSFVIHIRKKEGKENHDQGINENDENEEDEENDEDDDDEDNDDEDDEAEDDGQENTEEKSSRKDTLKEFFKSAKAAVTNRARFTDPSLTEPEATQKGSAIKAKNTEENTNLKDKSKKVLLDANIKVDSTIGSALKYILKSKTKDKENHSNFADDETLISDRGSQDQLDPELIRMYEHLIRNNPRVKRYFLANCSKKGN